MNSAFCRMYASLTLDATSAPPNFGIAQNIPVVVHLFAAAGVSFNI